jgi:hypothetical protein
VFIAIATLSCPGYRCRSLAARRLTGEQSRKIALGSSRLAMYRYLAVASLRYLERDAPGGRMPYVSKSTSYAFQYSKNGSNVNVPGAVPQEVVCRTALFYYGKQGKFWVPSADALSHGNLGNGQFTVFFLTGASATGSPWS